MASYYDRTKGILEMLANMGTGGLAEMGGGLTYAMSAPFVGNAAAQHMKQSVQNAYTYQPRTEEARNMTGVLSSLAAPVLEPFAGAGKRLGDATYGATGSPLLGALATAAPQAALELADRANIGALRRGPVMGVYESDVSRYGIDHRPPRPNTDTAAPFYQLDAIYPDDVYSANAAQYYGTGNMRSDRAAFDLARKIRGNPDAEVSIYRAVPKENADAPINAGDWVTASRDYARMHGESLGDYAIIEKKVKAKELWTNGDSIHEFGWWPNN